MWIEKWRAKVAIHAFFSIPQNLITYILQRCKYSIELLCKTIREWYWDKVKVSTNFQKVAFRSSTTFQALYRQKIMFNRWCKQQIFLYHKNSSIRSFVISYRDVKSEIAKTITQMWQWNFFERISIIQKPIMVDIWNFAKVDFET